jgi:hypothetical protein
MYWLLLVPAVIMAVVVLLVKMPYVFVLEMIFIGNLLAVMAYSMRWLRVVDEGDRLAVRYGPVPLFRNRFRYADIAAAEPSKTTYRDGWGIHWLPGRGWTYNLWGFDCVELTYKNGRTVRVGTNDPAGLNEFLQGKLRAVR